MNKPNLFILGAPKCGTTSMAHYLNQHPDIFVSKFKEPHYFNFDSDHRFAFSQSEYLKNFQTQQSSYKYFVDASVWYLYSKVAADEILKFSPSSKFIVMLRNPIEMFYSLHAQLLFSGIENIKSPLQAWDLQKNRERGKDVPYACRDKSFLQYKKVCKLGMQVELLLKKIPRNQIHFITLDELKEDPEKVFSEVLSFLNLKNLSLSSYDVINEKKEKRFGWVSNLFSFINKIKRVLHIRKGIGFANFIVKKNVKSSTDKYKIEFETMKPMLQDVFKDDIKLLEKIIGKNIKGWQRI